MCTFKLPVAPEKILDIKHQLIDYYKIEIPVILWENQVFLRVSINGYNSWNDIDLLVEALKKERIYQ